MNGGFFDWLNDLAIGLEAMGVSYFMALGW